MKKTTIYYFTDPICSFCWAIEPIIKRFQLLYDDYIEIKYVMGGLLPDWKSYEEDGGYIQQPKDVAPHWLEVGKAYNMAINTQSWTNDYVTSSYPPSISYNAVVIDDLEKASLFLRKLKQLLFLKGINISREDVLYETAKSIGVDMNNYSNNIESGIAEKRFTHDMIIAKNFEVMAFPTLIFKDEQKQIKMEGYNTIETLEKTLKMFISNVVPKNLNLGEVDILKMYSDFTAREFAVILNINMQDAYNRLNSLVNDKMIMCTKINYLEYYSVL